MKADDDLNAFFVAFPEIGDLVRKYALGMNGLSFNRMHAREFEKEAKASCVSYIKEVIAYLKDAYMGKAMRMAYLDVVRYQTDIRDAAIEWQVDERALTILRDLNKPINRFDLEIPDALRKLRELR